MRSRLRIAMIILAVEVVVAVVWAGRARNIPVRALSDCETPIPLLEAKIADIKERIIWAETSMSEAESDVDAKRSRAEFQILIVELAQGQAALSQCSIWVATQGRIGTLSVN